MLYKIKSEENISDIEETKGTIVSFFTTHFFYILRYQHQSVVPIIKNLVWTCISSNTFMVCHYKFQYAMSIWSLWSWNPYYLPLWSTNCLPYRSTWDRFLCGSCCWFFIFLCSALSPLLVFFFLFTVALSAFRFKASWLSPFNVFEVFLQDGNIQSWVTFRYHEAQNSDK
jgi:hypothetical protein